MFAADLSLEEYLVRVLDAAGFKAERAVPLAAALRQRENPVASPLDLWAARLSVVRIAIAINCF